jgi:hypothetical protein
MPKATHVPITTRRALLAGAALVAPASLLPALATLDRLAGRTVA